MREYSLYFIAGSIGTIIFTIFFIVFTVSLNNGDTEVKKKIDSCYKVTSSGICDFVKSENITCPSFYKKCIDDKILNNCCNIIIQYHGIGEDGPYDTSEIILIVFVFFIIFILIVITFIMAVKERMSSREDYIKI